MEIDEDLLDGEDESDCDDFEISNEKEEALLQDDEEYTKPKSVYEEEYSKSRDASDEEYSKFRDRYDFEKDSMSDVGDEDILNLDVEEDFQDVDEKTMGEEQPKEETTENVQNIKSLSESSSVKNTKISKQNDVAPKWINNNVTSKRNPPAKRTLPRNDKWKRGSGRGNFQTRSNYGNNLQRKRNGTVLINPRYEGTVQINENSARLAWDNSQYPQNNTNFVQPWASGNYDPNTTSQLLKNILVQSGNLLVPPIQPPPQNYYHPPPNNYERPLVFEPPPNIQEQTRQSTYVNQQQVSNHQMYSSTQPSASSLPSYPLRGIQHNCNSQEVKGGNQTFNSYSSYGYNNRSNNRQNYSFQAKKNENRNFPHKWPNSRPGTYSNNNSSQNKVQNKKLSGVDNGYQNRYPSYDNNGFKREHFSNCEVKTESRESSGDKREGNGSYAAHQFSADSTTSFVNKDGNFKPVNEIHGITEKKPRFKENVTTIEEHDKHETTLKAASTNNVVSTQEDEDEETRLYLLRIEEQKKERERLLQIKEERRKQMLLLQRKRDETKLVSQEIQHQQVVDQNSVTESMNPPNTSAFKYSAGTEQYFSSEGPVQRPVQQFSRQSHNKPFTFSGHFQTQKQHSTTQLFVQRSNQYFAPPPSTVLPQQQFYHRGSDLNLTADVSNHTFKVSDFKVVVQDKVSSSVPKTEASSSSFMSNRVVVVKGNKNNEKPSVTSSTNEASKQSSDVDQGLSSFLNNRKVLKKDTTLPNTRLVVVNNLSTTINQNKLMALTRGIGEIQYE